MLNPAQASVVTTEGHCLVAAGPGSGKTHVASMRAARLLKDYPTDRLCAVTFTAEAARELTARILRLVPAAKGRLSSGTFHSLCMRQLTSGGKRPRLIHEYQSKDILRRIHSDLQRRGFSEEFDVFLLAVMGLKSNVDGMTYGEGSEMHRLALRLYQEALDERGVLDFADLINHSVLGMREGKVPLVPVQHLLIDEFQDTDGSQYAWMAAHRDQGVQITIVGDDDQSIYAWRWALGYHGMKRFEQESRATTIALDTTYRCERRIVMAAAQLIAHNPNRIPKHLKTAKVEMGEVRVINCRTRDQELGVIADRLEEALQRDAQASPPVPRTYGVLARTNNHLDLLETHLRGRVDYERVGGTSLWDLLGPTLLLGVLRSIANHDLIGVDALLGRCGYTDPQLAALRVACNVKVQGSGLRFIHCDMSTLRKINPDLVRFRQLYKEWSGFAHAGKLSNALGGIVAEISSQVEWGGRANPSPEVINEENRRLAACSNAISKLTGTIAEVVRKLELRSPTTASKPVRLMTLHGSKGLEFDEVWMMACEQGVLPSTGGIVEEDRRLMYVGMTRARSVLTVSHATEGGTAASQFITEAGLFESVSVS